MNEELLRMYEADVADHRQGLTAGTPEYASMRALDRKRRSAVQEMIDRGEVTQPEDYFHAARIFQHGDIPEDARLAFELASKAAEGGYRPAKWLSAAAYDRWLVYQGKPQKYGTQYFSDGKHQHLFDVDPGTTDEERANWDVPPLQEQLRKAEEATRNFPALPIPPNPPDWLMNAIRKKLSEENNLDERPGQ